MTKEQRRDHSLFFRVSKEEQLEFKSDARSRHMEQAEFFRYIWRAFKDKLSARRAKGESK